MSSSAPGPKKPTVILVPGAWHDSSLWDRVTPLLQAEGFHAIPTNLASAQSNENGINEDIAGVKSAIVSQLQQGNDVVVVAHSFGGVVGPSAFRGITTGPESDGIQRVADDMNGWGHIKGLIMTSTGFMPSGMAFLQPFQVPDSEEGGELACPPFMRVDQEKGTAHLNEEVEEGKYKPKNFFYHDLDDQEAEERVARLKMQSLAAFTSGELVYAGWKDVPVWYIGMGADRAMPLPVQHMMAQMAKDQGADLRGFTEVEGAGHCGMISKAEGFVKGVVDAVEAFTSEKKGE